MAVYLGGICNLFNNIYYLHSSQNNYNFIRFMENAEKGTQELPVKAVMDMFWQKPSTGPNKVPSDDGASTDA